MSGIQVPWSLSRSCAVQAQRPVAELARDARGTSVQHGRVDARETPADLGTYAEAYKMLQAGSGPRGKVILDVSAP